MDPQFKLKSAVSAIMIATFAVFVLQHLPVIGPWLWRSGALVPDYVFGRGEIWRLVSYMFLHSTDSIFHFFFNMLALWMFGTALEERWGPRRFMACYALFGIGSGLFSLVYLAGPVARFVPIIGASGAIYGILTAYAVYFPNREILLFFIVPVRAWVMVAGFAVLSLLLAVSEPGGAVAHIIHLGGIVIAFAYLKTGPAISRWADHTRGVLNERAIRARAGETMRKKHLFEEKVDPILEKISRQGMESLTREERNILRDAGKGGRELLKKKNIIPFDAFRKRT